MYTTARRSDSLSKTTFWLSIIAFGTGILLLLPVHTGAWFPLSAGKAIHILAATLLAVMLFRLVSTHMTVQLSNPFKSGIKKWNGFKYLFYLILAFGSGVLLLIGIADPWAKNFHLGIGAWSLLVGWKHIKRK